MRSRRRSGPYADYAAHVIADATIPIRALLGRVRHLIASDCDGHFKTIETAFEDGRLMVPHKPMSDAELGEAIKEFVNGEKSATALRDLNDRLRG